MAVADAENGISGVQNRRIYVRTAGFVNARRATGNDDPFAGAQPGSRCVAGLDIGEDSKLANTARDEMRVLAARVEDGDLRRRCRSQISERDWRAVFRSAVLTLPAGAPPWALLPRLFALRGPLQLRPLATRRS